MATDLKGLIDDDDDAPANLSSPSTEDDSAASAHARVCRSIEGCS
jgi:hypothetical protein